MTSYSEVTANLEEAVRICKKYRCELWQWEQKALEEKEAQSATTVSGQMEQI